MFRTKEDVDRHVQEISRKSRNDRETMFAIKYPLLASNHGYPIVALTTEDNRYMRYYQVAKLYYNIKEWEIARRYVSNYLSVHEGSAEAHKLLGQVYDRQGQKKQALEQFKCSLELNAKQADLVLRVCELLVEVDDPVNADRARYWCERAEATHPHHPVVFKLKEHLLTTSGKQDLTDLEGLIAAEIVHRPTDVSLRIRLLKLYLDNNKVEDAYNHASEIEGRYLFRDEFGWYTCLVQVCQAYESSNGSKDLKFYLMYVSVLERAVALCLQEHTTFVCRSVSDSVQALFRLDQMLEKACQFNPVPSERELYHEFLKHMRAQLCFHLAEFLLKKANKEQSNWKEAVRSAAPLLLHSLVAPVDTQALWLLNLAQGHKKAANRWRLEAAHRYSQAGHVLLALSSDHHTHFLEKVAQFCSFSWRERLYQRIFVLREHQQLITTSQFVSHPQLADPPLRLPSLTELQPYDEQSQLLHPSSLHHLVWLGLQYLSPMRVSGGSMRSDFSCRVMEDLQLTCPNLNNCTTETLTKLDVDAFLYASAFCAGATLEEQLRAGLWGSDRPPTLPASITQQLCTGPQAKWWSAVHQIYMRQTSSDNVGELRLTIQRGLEVIRVNGNHGLDVRLLVLLARVFHYRANALSTQTEVVGEVPALEARAALYWNCCIPLLEKLQRNQAIRPPSTKLFDFQCKDLTPAELSAVVEEGRLFLACQLMNSNKLEQACETFNQLKSPYASFYQASVYRRLADEELGNQSGEMITSEMRSRHIVMLTKARDALYLTLDRLRSPSMDQNHPLNAELIEHIDDVERRLNRIDPEMFNDVNLNDLDGLDAESLPSMASAGDNFHFNLPSSSMNLTPRVARNGVNPHTGFRPTHGHRLNNSNILRDLNATYRTEARPSPERLQHARDSGAMATFLEQSKRTMDELKGIRDELKVIRDDQKGISLRMEALENVLHMDELKKEIQEIHREMKNRRGTLSSQLNVELAQVYGEEGLSVFDEEDYGDDLVSGRPMGAAATYAAFRPTGYTPMLFPQGDPQPPPPLMPPFFPQVYQPYYNPTAAGLPFSEGQQLPDFRTPQFPPPMVVPPPVNVVITTSDTLPTSTPTNLPTLSVTIPPQHRQPLKQQQQQQMQPSVPHNFQISMPPQAQLPQAAVLERDAAALSPVIPLSTQQLLSNVPLPRYSAVTSPATNKSVAETSTHRLSRPSASEDEGAEEDEHDPSFEPLIPLPAEVDLTTGEEGETLLFEQRAKLFRFVDKEWKERGVGQIKILFNAVSGKSRVLMRREQVLKICANHLLQADMDLAPMKNRAWMWVANDFADEEVRLEKLCVRFKTADEAQNFKEAFDKAKVMSANTTATQITTTVNATPAQSTTTTATPTQATTVNATPAQSTTTTATPTQATTVNATPAQSTTTTATPTLATTVNATPSHSTTVNATSTPATNVSATSTPATTVSATSTPATTVNATSTQPTATNATVTQSTTTTGSINTFSVGGLKFFSNPKTTQEPKQSPIKEVPSKSKEKPNPFAGFSFTSTPKKSETESPSKSTQEDQPLMFNTPVTATTFSTLAQQAKQPAFKKDDSFSGWQGTGTPVFGGAAARTTPGGEEERVDDYESTAEFQPVIPLPELVEVKTGEEGQEVLFQERAKLLRFDSDGKQWKERGVGQMKVLKEPGTGRVRLLMRREQVLKVCCNHYLSPGLELKPLSSSDRAWSWCAQDFSEGELRVETLAIKFKTQEQAHEFKRLIDKVQGEMASPAAPPPHQGPPAWKCPDCMFPNADDASHCRSCKKRLPRSGAESPRLAVPLTANRLPKLTEVIRPKEGSWECGTCYLINEGSDIRCVACDSVKPTKGSRSPGATLPDVADQWVCSSCQFTNYANQDSCTGCIAANPSKSAGVSKVPVDTRPLSELFKPKSGSWECKMCYVRNSDDSAATCIACYSPNPNAPEQPTGTTEKPATPFTYGLSGLTLGTTQQSGFNLGAPSEASMQFSFGIVPIPAATSSSSPATTTGTTSPATQPLLEPEKSGAKDSTEADHSFIFGSQSQFNFNFTGVRPKSPGKTPRSPKSPGGGLGLSEGEDSLNDEGVDDGEGEHIYFQPVIPLPDKVPVITGEEDEEVVYCHRAKLYRFVASEWKERGVGDFKILRHPDTCKIRLVMRRDQVLKLCLNHFLTPEISFTAKGDKAWMWYAPDFAEGQVTNECFVLRFKTSEIADQFKEAVSKSQEELSNKTVSPPKRHEQSGSSLDKGDGDGNSVSPAMASFSFSLPESGFSLSGRLPENPSQSKGPVARTLFGAVATKKELSSDSDEVEVVGEVVATKEERAAAELLMLPPNFYLYRLKPPCPGCPGCEQESSDSDTESASRVTHSEQKRVVESLTEASVSSTLVPPQKPAASSTSFNLNICTANAASNLDKLTARDTSNLGSASKPSSGYIFGNNNQSMTDSIFGGRLQMSTPPLWNTTRAEPESTNTQVVTTDTAQIGFKTSTSEILGSENTTSPIFGGKKTITSSIFGDGSTTTASSIFGVGSTTTASSIFGGGSTTAASSIFGGGSTTAASSIFGGGSTTAASSIFGGGRTTAASSILSVGSTTAASSIFGGGSTITVCSIFGGGSTTTASSIFGGGSTTTTGSSFGGTNTTTTGSTFGGTNTTTTGSTFGGGDLTTTGAVFGSGNTSNSSSIFGGSNTTNASSIFGGGNTTNASSIFGSRNTSSSSIFGVPNTTCSVFGGGNTTTTSSIFTGTNTTTSSIFGGTFQTMPTTSSFSFQPSASKGSIFDKALGTSFGAPALFEAKDSKPISMFGGQTTLIAVKSPPDQVKEQDVAPILPVDNSLTFATLATQEPAAFSEGDKNFLWQGAGTKVFGGSVAANTSHSSDDGDADSSVVSHDPHFEPIIALPDAIEVCTGEEQEEKMFCQRAKLYRYDASTKEWKERGVGEMKILHHPTNHTFRLLLRREQVHKVVCNHLITADLDLKPLATSDKAWCWGALNYTDEGEGRLEELAVRFKLSDTARDFKERIEDIRTILLVQQTETLEVTEVTEDNESEEVSYSRRTTYTVEEVEGEPLVWNPSNEEEELEYEEDAEKTLMFEKRATLLVRDPSTQQWDTQGPGDLQVIYDPDIFAARIYFECDRSGEQRCNTVIATNTSLEVDKKDCTWCSVDNSQDTPTQKTFMARFSSVEAAQEFESVFHEGLAMAEQSEIMEHCIPYSSTNDDDDDDVDDDREQ